MCIYNSIIIKTFLSRMQFVVQEVTRHDETYFAWESGLHRAFYFMKGWSFLNFSRFISLRNWLQLFYLLPVNSTIHWTYLLATGWLTLCQSSVEHQNGKLSICQQLFMISRFKCSLYNVNISLTKKYSY